MFDWQRYLNFPLYREHFPIISQANLLLITIAFNNHKTIELQLRFLKKNLSDNHCFLVVDNSSDSKESKLIRDYCRLNNTPYLRPGLRFYRSSSKSHGSALNWVYHYLVKKSSFPFFGFIDHDLYPIRKTSVLEYLSLQPVYGALQARSAKWYLWAGFCFFDKNYLKGKAVDFFPQEKVIDTGGMNYYAIYRWLDKDKLIFPNQSYLKIAGGETVQESHIQVLGDWLHTFNASGWLEFEDATNRNKSVSKILEDLLND